MKLETRVVSSVITLCFAVWCLIFTSLVLSFQAQASTESPWISPNQPALEFVKELSSIEVLPSTIGGNRDCEKREILTRESRPWILQQKASFDSCAIDAKYGTVASGYLQRPGTNLFGRVISSVSDQPVNIIAVPGSATMLQYINSPINGVYMAIRDGESSISNSDAHTFTGSVTHKISPNTIEHWIKDKSGNRLPIILNSIAFSNSGKWMVGDMHNVGKVRVNLDTKEVLPFGGKTQYGTGFDPTPQMAISSDGRYAIVATVQYNLFTIYDLATCGPVPEYITKGVNCSSKDLIPFLRSSIPGLSGASTIRFRGDYTFDFYAFVGSGGSLLRKHYMLTAAGQEKTLFEYLALGDSFASGEGAYAYKPETDTDNNKCHLSQQSYPYLIGLSLQLDSYESVACSGARINDVMKNRGEDAQGKGKSDKSYDVEILENFLPGYRAQYDFIDEKRPSVITLSAGGNDVGFKNKIVRCAMILITDTCFKYYEDRYEAVLEVNSQFEKIVSMYRQIKDASPGAKVYVIGYPQIANPNGNCAVNVRMEKGDLEFGWDFVNYLNSTIELAAKKAGVFYVDTTDAFKNHRLCEAVVEKDIAVNGVTNGDDFFPLTNGPLGNESFHPTARGHKLLRDEILRQTDNLTSEMPLPDHSITVPDPTDSMDMLKGIPKQNRVIRWVTHLDEPVIENTTDAYTAIDGGVREAGKTIEIKFYNPDAGLKPNSQVELWMHSEPTLLDTTTIDHRGGVAMEITIPEDTTPGYHTLHFYGKNTSDQDVDLYQELFVVASLDDYDGDGILNSQEPCLFVEPANQDIDGDGIDDACDGVIGERTDELPTENPGQEQPSPENNENQPGDNPTSPSTANESGITPGQTLPITSNPETSRIAEELRQIGDDPDANTGEILGETSNMKSSLYNDRVQNTDGSQKVSEGGMFGKVLLGSVLLLSAALAAYLIYRRIKTSKDYSSSD